MAAAKAEKEAKLAAEKAEKEAKLAAAKAEKEAKKAAEKNSKKNTNEDDDEEPEIVKKITFEEKKYLRSMKTGIIYDYEKYINEQEQVVVGKWNENENKIEFSSKVSDVAEEMEEEYESDSDNE